MGRVWLLDKEEGLTPTSTRTDRPVEIAIVGLGIHGTHILRRLVENPTLSDRRFVTIDPYPTPCWRWIQRTSNCGMSYLRSPASHGVNPDFKTIRRFATRLGWDDSFIPPYHRPALNLFNEHLRSEYTYVKERSEHLVGTLRDLDYRRDEIGLTVQAENDRTSLITAKHVVLALGTPKRFIPSVFRGIQGIHHVYDPAFNPETIAGDSTVAIVGGGIAGAHLAIFLAQKGVLVTILNRDPFYVAQFDSDPCFIGPRCGDPFRRIEDYAERRKVIAESRRPGSIPIDLFRSLESLERGNSITIVRSTVTSIRRRSKSGSNTRFDVETSNRDMPTRSFDRVVLATGFEHGPPEKELIRAIAIRNRLPLDRDGFPILTRSLRWIPSRHNAERRAGGFGCTPQGTRSSEKEAPQVYCTGALAELEIGPPARNIIGAHLAGRRIEADLQQRYSLSTEITR